MPSTSAKITQAVIAAALKSSEKSLIIRDTVAAGLCLRFGTRGASYYLDYKPIGRRPDGRRWASKSFKIGDTLSHSPDEARRVAGKLKVKIAEGLDPSAERSSQRAQQDADRARATTLIAEAEKYIVRHLKGSERHVSTQAGALRNGLKEMGVLDSAPCMLSVKNVRTLCDLHEGKAAAVHRFGALNRFCEHLLDREIIDENPCQRLAKRSRPKPPKPRTRVYTAKEVQKLLQASEQMEGAFGQCLEAAVFLPLRIGELLELRVQHVDRTACAITLPALMTKNGDPFTIPIPNDVLHVFQAVDAEPDTRVFQLASRGKRFDARTKFTKRIRDLSGVIDFRFHDLRRTFVTTLAEHDTGNEIIADALLNHRQAATRSGVVGVYNNARLATQKRAVMAAWGQMVQSARKNGSWTASPGADVVNLQMR